MLLSIPDFIGRFHPVLVHLPVGILLVAACFSILASWPRFKHLRSAVPMLLLLGMLGAVASSISGWLLASSGDYEGDTVATHQWLGIATAGLSLVTYLLRNRDVRLFNGMILLLAVLLTVTGHYGGSLTHGSDYLTAALGDDADSSRAGKLKPIANVQEAHAYTDIVQPILQSKCYSCHGPSKQKGKLRLDDHALMLKGGESGLVLVAGKADESELIARLLLSKDNEEHMPPKEKPQLSKQEVQLLQWWVNAGADVNRKVKDLPQDAAVKPVLLALQTGQSAAASELSYIPAKPVPPAADSALQRLKALGVVIAPVAANSTYLSANLINAQLTPELFGLLQQIKEQLIWLKLGHTGITDQQLTNLSSLTSLTRLYLNHTGISDAGLEAIKSSTSLQYLNLVHTKVTAAGLSRLKELRQLNELYVYQTEVISSDWNALKKLFPKTNIDTGGYRVPMLESDTVKLKAPLR